MLTPLHTPFILSHCAEHSVSSFAVMVLRVDLYNLAPFHTCFSEVDLSEKSCNWNVRRHCENDHIFAKTYTVFNAWPLQWTNPIYTIMNFVSKFILFAFIFPLLCYIIIQTHNFCIYRLIYLHNVFIYNNKLLCSSDFYN